MGWDQATRGSVGAGSREVIVCWDVFSVLLLSPWLFSSCSFLFQGVRFPIYSISSRLLSFRSLYSLCTTKGEFYSRGRVLYPLLSYFDLNIKQAFLGPPRHRLKRSTRLNKFKYGSNSFLNGFTDINFKKKRKICSKFIYQTKHNAFSRATSLRNETISQR